MVIHMQNLPGAWTLHGVAAHAALSGFLRSSVLTHIKSSLGCTERPARPCEKARRTGSTPSSRNGKRILIGLVLLTKHRKNQFDRQ